MKTKRIWIWAFIFGILATISLYLFIITNSEQNVVATSSNTATDNEKAPAEEKTEKETTKTEDEEFVNEMLPMADGTRAMSIAVEDVQGVAGFIKPGAYVDVVSKMLVPEEAQEGQHDSTVIVLQNLKVLAIGHAADNEEENKRYQMVTLEVNPQEALTLGFATKYELYLILRKEGDKKLEKEHLHIHEDEVHKGVWRK